jgi:caffeoyl-CoA O-methyltransferase
MASSDGEPPGSPPAVKTPLEFADKLLPDQPEHTSHFTGTDLVAALYGATCRASGIVSPHEEFSLEYSDRFALEEMASSPVNLRFFQFIAKVGGARRILEIGSFIGLSAMYFAKALPDDGEVVTIEKFAPFADLARRNFARNGLERKIRLLEGDGLDILPGLATAPRFDVVFLDANKERYRDYMELAIPLLSPRGIMIVDDVFFHGDAISPTPRTEKGRGVKAALDFAASLDGWLRIVLPMANGILLLVQR